MVTVKAALQHYLNPLHVLCRLVDFGFSMKRARAMSAWYENNVLPILHLWKTRKINEKSTEAKD